MLWDLALPLALRTLAIGWMQFLGSRGFELQLGYVGVNNHDFLLVEQYAIGKTQPPGCLLVDTLDVNYAR